MNTPENTPSSFREATDALAYTYVKGNGNIQLYRDLHRDGEEYRINRGFEKEFLDVISRKDSNGSRAVLRRVYEEAVENCITPIESRWMVIYFYEILVKALDRVNLNTESQMTCQSMLTDMMNAVTLPEIVEKAEQLVVCICDVARADEKENDLGSRAMAWIQENFWKPTFSLQECADAMHVTPEHLSRSVKSSYGRTFMDIVSEMKLERAKSILLKTDKKMDEVASLSGYGTEKSFFRNFKQAEGMTPGEWRRNNRS